MAVAREFNLNPAQERPRSTPANRQRWRCGRLWFQIHFDGFRRDPAGYLQGVIWRIRRLRVRSRHRLSALVGRSSSAYAFWVSCREPELLAAAERKEAPTPIVVVDCRNSNQGLERTIASLGGSKVVLLGGPHRADHAQVASPAEIGPELIAGNWVCPIDCGDELAPGAFAIYSAAIAKNPSARIAYSDDDLIDDAGARRDPHFKPTWNAELFAHHDFVSGASMLKADPAQLSGLGGAAWPSALVQQLIKAGPPLRVPLVLHHRRRRQAPVAPPHGHRMAPSTGPSVSVIVPTKNQCELLATCLDGVRSSKYAPAELIIIDNGSDDPATMRLLEHEEADAGVQVLRMRGPFNYSALNNAAAQSASGSLLCFLNNDIEMVDSDWLSMLVAQAVRDDVGAVGAMLLYEDRTVQHAGVYTGIGGGAGHGHRFLAVGEEGYFQRHRLPQQVSAVTAACLVVGREKFLAVGGFDEETFPVAFNDVDLCLKLNARGWCTIYEPRAVLIHHESRSRGSDRAKANRKRFAGELAALKRKWRTDVERDPFHHPSLSPFTEQFFIAV